MIQLALTFAFTLFFLIGFGAGICIGLLYGRRGQ